jgi:hypothetical protein
MGVNIVHYLDLDLNMKAVGEPGIIVARHHVASSHQVNAY